MPTPSPKSASARLCKAARDQARLGQQTQAAAKEERAAEKACEEAKKKSQDLAAKLIMVEEELKELQEEQDTGNAEVPKSPSIADQILSLKVDELIPADFLGES